MHFYSQAHERARHPRIANISRQTHIMESYICMTYMHAGKYKSTDRVAYTYIYARARIYLYLFARAGIVLGARLHDT